MTFATGASDNDPSFAPDVSCRRIDDDSRGRCGDGLQLDLQMTAKVIWYPSESRAQETERTADIRKEREFDSVDKAVIFVMELLPPDDGSSVKIETDGRSMDIAAIEYAYQKLKPDAWDDGDE
jgi:hypothetical protein